MEPKHVSLKVDIMVLNKIEVGVVSPPRHYLRTLRETLMLTIMIEKTSQKPVCCST